MSPKSSLKWALPIIIWIVPLATIGIFAFVEHLIETQSDIGAVLRTDKVELHFGLHTIVGLVASGLLVLVLGVQSPNDSKLNTLRVFCILYLCMVYPGILLGISQMPNAVMAAYVYAAATVSFALGVSVNGHRQGLLQAYRKIAAIPRRPHLTPTALRNTSPILFWCFSTVALSIIVVIASGGYRRVVAIPAILETISSLNVSDAAYDVREARSGVYFTSRHLLGVLSNHLVNVVIPIGALAIISIGKAKQNRTIRNIGWFLIILCGLFFLGSGSRLGFARFSLFFLVWLSWSRFITKKQLLRHASFILLGLILMTLTLGRMQDQGSRVNNIAGSLNRLVERITIGKGRSSGYVFAVFPDLFKFEEGRTIITKLLGTAAGDETIARQLMRDRRGREGAAGPQAFAELFLNWGLPGVLIGAFIIGILVQEVDKWLYRNITTDPIQIACFCYVMVAFAYWGYGDVASPKTIGLHVLAAYYFAYKVMIKQRAYQPLLKLPQ